MKERCLYISKISKYELNQILTVTQTISMFVSATSTADRIEALKAAAEPGRFTCRLISFQNSTKVWKCFVFSGESVVAW